MNEFERLLAQQQAVRILQSIETAAWWIVALLAVIAALVLIGALNRRRGKEQDPSWAEIVEETYDAGRYDAALQTLAAYELLRPRSALVKYWQAKCQFQRESWNEAVAKFEECCRLEPPYRKYVRDYMAFIEMNRLVPSVNGYLATNARRTMTRHDPTSACPPSDRSAARSMYPRSA